jgi:hypothetical protein
MPSVDLDELRVDVVGGVIGFYEFAAVDAEGLEERRGGWFG